MSLHAVILAGGSGTRFWPLSRAKKPKQFLALVTARTLIDETFLRAEPLCPAERTWVVCGQDHAEAVRLALPRLPEPHLIAEPAARNTAPAIGLAAVHAKREDPDAIIAVLPSDQHVVDQRQHGDHRSKQHAVILGDHKPGSDQLGEAAQPEPGKRAHGMEIDGAVWHKRTVGWRS